MRLYTEDSLTLTFLVSWKIYYSSIWIDLVRVGLGRGVDYRNLGLRVSCSNIRKNSIIEERSQMHFYYTVIRRISPDCMRLSCFFFYYYCAIFSYVYVCMYLCICMCVHICMCVCVCDFFLNLFLFLFILIKVHSLVASLPVYKRIVIISE